jgi:hypothetical protein
MSQQKIKETEANLEVEAALAEFQGRRTLLEEKFDRAEEFRKSRKAKAAQRKVKEANVAANAEKARKEEEEFERRLAKFKAEMDRYIPEEKEEPLETHPFYNTNGKNRVIAGDTAEIHNEETDVVPQSLELKESSEKQSSVANKNEVITPKAEDERIGRLQDEESLQSLPPIPKRIRYEDLKLESVQSQSVTSLHTGAKLQVNRVPASRIPPTSGISVMGLHPHASAWTKSPPWAQAIVACGIGAGFAGLGFGFYKLIRKLLTATVSKDMGLKRSHVREWNVTTVGATGKM